jgi:hypothetical protein
MSIPKQGIVPCRSALPNANVVENETDLRCTGTELGSQPRVWSSGAGFQFPLHDEITALPIWWWGIAAPSQRAYQRAFVVLCGAALNDCRYPFFISLKCFLAAKERGTCLQ